MKQNKITYTNILKFRKIFTQWYNIYYRLLSKTCKTNKSIWFYDFAMKKIAEGKVYITQTFSNSDIQ